MYSQSLFLYEVGVIEVKETDFKDTAHDKRQKTLSIKTSSQENAKKHKVNEQAPQKMAKIIF